ncbi:MAG: NAD(P)-dependent oxidoreductase [Clostridia bacterium]
MKITLLEPLAVKSETTANFAKTIEDMGHEFISFDTRNEDVEELIKRTADSDAVIITNLAYPKEVIEKCPNLKYVNVAFTGVDRLDVPFCKEKGIQVSNASGYSDIAVAELAFSMMLNISRYVNQGDTATREGKTKDGLVGTELYGKTLGVIGCGKIGSRVCEIASVFGCKVLGFDPMPNRALEEKGVDFVSLETLMAESDIVTVHVPQMPATIGLINESNISLMKPTAIFINTARGPIVDSQALANALNNGQIRAAGIDVFETEPPIASEHPLLNSKNTLLTPHVAFATKEALERRADIVLDNMTSWLNGIHKNVI